MKTVLISLGALFYSLTTFATDYVWNGSVGSQWTNASNWTPSTGFPGAADKATIVAAANNPILTQNTSVLHLVVTSGTLDLGGFTLFASGNTTISGGMITKGRIDVTGQTNLVDDNSVTFSGTCEVNAEITGSVDNLYFNGGVFNNSVSLTKTWSTPNISTGTCVFNSTFSLTNSSTEQIYLSANTISNFTYNGIATFKVQSAGDIYASYRGTVKFNDDIIVSSIGNNGIIEIGNTSASTISVVSGKKLAIGNEGFAGGSLRLTNLIYEDPLNLEVTGTANISLTSCTFQSPVVIKAPVIRDLKTSLFNDAALFEFNASSTSGGYTLTNAYGGNIFKKAATFRLIGSSYWWTLNNSAPDQFESDVILETKSSCKVILSKATNNVVMGDLYINSQYGDFSFGESSGTTTIYGDIKVGASGFTNGTISATNLTQVTSTRQTKLFLAGSALAQFKNCVFNGEFNLTSASLGIGSCTFNENASVIKVNTLTSTAYWSGGNVFKKNLSLTNTGSGTLRLCTTTGDEILGSLIVDRQSTGDLQLAYAGTTKVAGNISLISNQAIGFSTASGSSGETALTGTTDQTVSGNTSSVSFSKLKIDKPAGKVVVNSPLIITNLCTFVSGIAEPGSGSITFNDNAAASGASDNSFVKGAVRKIGNDVFTFPIGTNGRYRPLSISSPISTTHSYTASYIAVNPRLSFSTFGPGLLDLSRSEYWTLNQNAGSGTALNVTLSWNNESGVQNPSDLVVAQWDGSKWINKGGTVAAPLVTSTVAVTSLSANNPFTLGGNSAVTLPVTLSYFRASIEGHAVNLFWGTETEKNASLCVIERSTNGTLFLPVGEQISRQSNSYAPIAYTFQDPFPFTGKNYYRLKFIDLDNSYEYSPVVMVQIEGNAEVSVYPVPSIDRQLYLRLNFEPAPEDKVIISDTQGTVVGTISADQFPSPIIVNEATPPGVYFLLYNGRNLQQRIRFILR